MVDYLLGAASGVGLCIGLLAVLGLYVKTHQEKVMRSFIRRGMQSAKRPRNASNNSDNAKTRSHS
jgi:hypothetical protein